MIKTSYFGNPWIGMFIKANDSITMLPVDSMDKFEQAVQAEFKTEVVKTTLGDSNLLGIYAAMNSNGVILPNVARDNEIAAIKKAGLNVYVSKEKHNAHGNNIAVSDKGGIANPNIEKDELKAMGDALGVELVPATVAGYTTVGSACIAGNNGFLAHYKTTEEEMAMIKDALKVYGSKGTVNTGTGFVAFGIVSNKNGYVAGEQTTAFELGRFEEAMGLIK